MFHVTGGVACKSGCKHTRGILANIKDVRKGCTLSPSGLNALRAKDNVCRGRKAIGKTTSYNSGGANRLNCMSLGLTA